jgi:uncharacterized protein YceK
MKNGVIKVTLNRYIMKKLIVILVVLILTGCATVSKSQIMRARGNYFILADKEKSNQYPAFLDWSKK